MYSLVILPQVVGSLGSFYAPGEAPGYHYAHRFQSVGMRLRVDGCG